MPLMGRNVGGYFMEDKIIGLVSEAKTLNSKVFSLPRILILTSLEQLDDDVTYRELKAGLELDDGVLFASLNVLEEMDYIKSKGIKLENKNMTSYQITGEGKQMLNMVLSWFMKWVK